MSLLEGVRGNSSTMMSSSILKGGSAQQRSVSVAPRALLGQHLDRHALVEGRRYQSLPVDIRNTHCPSGVSVFGTSDRQETSIRRRQVPPTRRAVIEPTRLLSPARWRCSRRTALREWPWRRNRCPCRESKLGHGAGDVDDQAVLFLAKRSDERRKPMGQAHRDEGDPDRIRGSR